MKPLSPPDRRRASRGFTLFELLIASAVMVIAVAGLMSMYVLIQRMWNSNTAAIAATSLANTGLERIVYGSDARGGLRTAVADTVSFASNSTSWQINFNTNRFLRYSQSAGTIVNESNFVLCRGIVKSSATLSVGGLSMEVAVAARNGTFASTSAVVSYVQFRN